MKYYYHHEGYIVVVDFLRLADKKIANMVDRQPASVNAIIVVVSQINLGLGQTQ